MWTRSTFSVCEEGEGTCEAEWQGDGVKRSVQKMIVLQGIESVTNNGLSIGAGESGFLAVPILARELQRDMKRIQLKLKMFQHEVSCYDFI
uniref:Uncharacterized protein n=1 Tax=Hyaloperonospora arabidopsidis (strain Emoy2) TaxID=559515 RepID=M4C359_HYAAE